MFLSCASDTPLGRFGVLSHPFLRSDSWFFCIVVWSTHSKFTILYSKTQPSKECTCYLKAAFQDVSSVAGARMQLSSDTASVWLARRRPVQWFVTWKAFLLHVRCFLLKSKAPSCNSIFSNMKWAVDFREENPGVMSQDLTPIQDFCPVSQLSIGTNTWKAETGTELGWLN